MPNNYLMVLFKKILEHEEVFERAVVKLQRSDSLFIAKATAVQILKIQPDTTATVADYQPSDFIERILNSQCNTPKHR